MTQPTSINPTLANQNAVPGAKVVIMGAPGTGKSHCLKTLLNLSLDVFAILTEPNSRVVLGPVLDQIHWAYVSPVVTGWSNLIKNAKNVMLLDAKQRAGAADGRREFTAFLDLLELCNNFVDQNGISYGPIDQWNTDRIVFLDSLTGINKMTKYLLVGNRTNMSLPEVGEAQDLISRFLDQITTTCMCHFVLTCHVTYELDLIHGGALKNLISTHGAKLAPVIPVFFNDFIYAYRQEKKFLWSTLDNKADTKTHNLPMQTELPQDFRLLLDGWMKKGGVISKTVL